MAGDFNKPTTGSSYSTFPTEIRDLCADIALMLDGTSTSNPPTGAKRWNAGSKKWEKHTGGGTWVDLIDKYMIDVDSVDGYHVGNSAGQIPLNNGTLNATLNAASLNGAIPGNSNGQIALSNGTVCSNLNADMLDGKDATSFPYLNGGNNSFTGHCLFTGSLSLPSTVSPNQMAIAAGYSSPAAAKILFGDGSGWRLQFGRRVSGAETIIASLYDTGLFSATTLQSTGSMTAGTGLTATNGNIVASAGRLYGNGSGGKGLGTITVSTSQTPTGGADGDVHFAVAT